MLTHSVEAEELAALHRLFGQAPHQQRHLEVDAPFLNAEHQLLTSDGRRAEICYVLHRGDPWEGVLVHRKVFYPESIFRLPTGGVHQAEGVLETLAREIEEETSFCLDLSPFAPGRAGAPGGAVAVTLQKFLGTLEYTLYHRAQARTHHYATYHFLVAAPAHAVPVALDPEEHVEDWQWQPIRAMKTMAERLEGVGRRSPHWGEWGRFRALSHCFVAEAIGRL